MKLVGSGRAAVIALLAVLGGGLAAVPASAGPSGCSYNPGTETATCGGDQSDGVVYNVDFPSTVRRLFVDPNGDITPPPGTPGIGHDFASTLYLRSHADITATGGADAIFAQGPGWLFIDSYGDLDGSNRGIYAFSWGSLVDVDSYGDIVAGEEGIFAQGAGHVSVMSRGDIDAGLKGIFAFSFNSGVSVDSVGDVDAVGEGIFAQGPGHVDVTSRGMLTTGGKGIYAFSYNQGVDVVSEGDVDADLDAIWAQGKYDVNVTSVGDLYSYDGNYAGGRAIFAHSTDGMTDVYSRGDLTSGEDAIMALGHTGVRVDSVGDLLTADETGRGIYAESEVGTTWVKSVGDIDAILDGIFAKGASDVWVSSTGDITQVRSTPSNTYKNGQRGIYAESLGGTVYVENFGDILVKDEAIFAKASERVEVLNVGDLTTFGTSPGRGLYAESLYSSLSIDTAGDIYGSQNEAIFAKAMDDLVLTNVGDLTSVSHRALFAQTLNGKLTIDSTGDIVGGESITEGVFASGYNGVDLTLHGDVTSADFRAVFIEAVNGPVNAHIVGDLNAPGTYGGEGIFADTLFDVDVSIEGDIVSNSFRGAFLQSQKGNLDYYGVGTVQAEYAGLFLSAGKDLTATVMGDVTSEEWDGIVVSRNVSYPSGSGLGTIDFTYGGGTVTSLGSTPDHKTNAIEVDAAEGWSYVTILEDGNVVGGGNEETAGDTNPSYGIYFKLGDNNLANHGFVRGFIDNEDGGRALGGEDGDDTVDNYGRVFGSVFLGGGTNTFNNMSGGWFDSGLDVDMGGGVVVNDGMLGPGGTGRIATTTFTDTTLTQNAGGQLWIDMDPTAPDTADLLTGLATANLDGVVVVQLTNLGLAYGSTQTATILDATNVNDNGLTGQGGVIQVAVTVNPNDVDIEVGLDFSPGGLAGNQRLMGDYFQGFYMSGIPGPLLDEFLDLANIPSLEGYGAALSSLGPDGSAGLASTALTTLLGSQQDMFSCPEMGGVGRFYKEGECAWFNGNYGRTSKDDGGGNLGYSDSAGGFSVGVQKAMADDWRLGLSGFYQMGDYASGTTTADRKLYGGGVVVKNNFNGFDVGLAVSGGVQNSDVERYIPLEDVTATSSQSLGFGSIAGRISRTVEIGANGYVEPSLEGAVTWLHRGGYSESGAGDLNLVVESGNDVVFRATPGVEVGTEHVIADDMVARLFVRGGATIYAGNGSQTAMLSGLGSSFTLPVDTDAVLADVAVGADLISANGWSLRGLYQGQFSSDTVSHSGRLKVRIDF